MSTAAQDLMAKRCDRAIAVILGFKEKECDEFLPRDVQQRLRKVILDQINDLFNLYCDINKSALDDSVVVNQLYVDRLNAIYEVVVGKNGSSSE